MFEKKKKKKEGKEVDIVNPEIQRENEEKAIETGKKKDFHDVGGFPKPPASGGFMH